MRRLVVFLPLLALILLIVLAGDVWACPGCKEAIAAQPRDASRMREGYFWSILFMMAMPFLLLGTGSFLVVRAVKRGALPQL